MKQGSGASGSLRDFQFLVSSFVVKSQFSYASDLSPKFQSEPTSSKRQLLGVHLRKPSVRKYKVNKVNLNPFSLPNNRLPTDQRLLGWTSWFRGMYAWAPCWFVL